MNNAIWSWLSNILNSYLNKHVATDIAHWLLGISDATVVSHGQSFAVNALNANCSAAFLSNL